MANSLLLQISPCFFIVQYQMTGAQSCWASGSPQAYTTVVQLECAAKQLPMTVYQAPNSCQLTYTLQTPLACSSAPPSPPTPTPTGTCGVSLGSTTYDFSSLMGTDLVGSDGGTMYQYYLSVCGDLTSPEAAGCRQVMSSASACQVQVNPKGGSYDIGDWPGANSDLQWSLIDPEKPSAGVQVRDDTPLCAMILHSRNSAGAATHSQCLRLPLGVCSVHDDWSTELLGVSDTHRTAVCSILASPSIASVRVLILSVADVLL